MSETDLSARSDAQLLAMAKAGERHAFGELYSRYLTPIYRYLRSRMLDPRDAEDLTETVFLRAYRALPRYQDRGWPFSAFLYQIARRLLVDHFRGRRPEVAWSEAHAQADDAQALEHGVERTLDWEAVSAAMTRLPDEHQEVIRLRVILGFSTREAAAWLGRTEGATRVLLHRALRSLRRSVRGDDG
jgi:RNA polymerase sigma-70 factor (ECF subfamily)